MYAHIRIISSVQFSRSVASEFLGPHGLQPTRLLCPWGSPGKNIGVGSRSLLQGIFLTEGLNLGLLNCRWILYHLSHLRSPYQTINELFHPLIYPSILSFIPSLQPN